MEGRSTVYSKITSEEKIRQINPENAQLSKDFLDYLASIDRSPKTIFAYNSDLEIFFVWNLEENANKDFIKISKRDFARFQNHALNVWKWSPRRIRRVKSTLSSLSNYITSMLDEEEGYEDYRSIIRKIESPANEAVREKTVLSTEQVQKLLDELVKREEYDKAVCIAILAYSGMRKAELLQMKMEYFTPDHLEFGCLYKTDKVRAKGRGVRGKQINKYVMNKVDTYVDLWRKKREELGIDSEWVLVIKRGDVWEQRTDIESWKDEFTQILDCPFYYHALRHALCTELVDMNIPAEVIREYFGWADVSLIQIYNDKSAVDSFGKYFSADGIIQQENKGIADIK